MMRGSCPLPALFEKIDRAYTLSIFLFLYIIIGVTGFEPTASASRTQRSTKLSHTPKNKFILHQKKTFVNNFFQNIEKNQFPPNNFANRI